MMLATTRYRLDDLDVKRCVIGYGLVLERGVSYRLFARRGAFLELIATFEHAGEALAMLDEDFPELW